MRLVLATFVLVGSVGSSSTFGHAHEGGDSNHYHVGFEVGHDADHDSHHHDGLEDEHDGPELLAGGGEFHLHSVLFGVPFTLLNASAERTSTHHVWLSVGCPTLSTSFDGSHLLKERIPWPFDWGLIDFALGIDSGSVTGRSAYGFDSSAPSCSPHARSVVLRC
jgi:hypothetical protein